MRFGKRLIICRAVFVFGGYVLTEETCTQTEKNNMDILFGRFYQRRYDEREEIDESESTIRRGICFSGAETLGQTVG